LDDLRGQHNKALAQITTLERRSKEQNDAAAEYIETTESQLAEKTKIAQVDEAEIEKLKDDYKEIHAFLKSVLEDLRKARAELEANKKRIAYQDQEYATLRSQSEKATADLKDALKAAQENEKQSFEKLSATGKELLMTKDECKKQTQSARSNAEKADSVQSKLNLADAARAKAEERVAQLEVIESQSNIKVAQGLREVAGLEQKLDAMRQDRDALYQQLQATTADLRNEQKLHKVTKTEHGAAGASLSVALAIQPALDETTRKLAKAEKELASVKETTAAAATAAAAAAAAALENEQKKSAEEFSTMKESLTTELASIKATLSAELMTTRDDWSKKLKETEDLAASEFETMKTALTTELAETKTKMAADHKATTEELTAKIKETEERAASEFAAMRKSLTDELAEQKQTMTTEHAKTVSVATTTNIDANRCTPYLTPAVDFFVRAERRGCEDAGRNQENIGSPAEAGRRSVERGAGEDSTEHGCRTPGDER
jgi:septal ring factor EnvC (AmiA/AmiB activator)